MKTLILNITITILTSGVVATLISSWIENLKQEKTTRFEALKIAILLEGYTIKCANKISKHETAISEKGVVGNYLTKIPSLPEFYITTGFLEQKKSSIANKLLIFSQEIQQADQDVSFWWDVVGDEECMRKAAFESTINIALKSLFLGKELRNAFNLPPRDLILNKFDILKFLEEKHRLKKG